MSVAKRIAAADHPWPMLGTSWSRPRSRPPVLLGHEPCQALAPKRLRPDLSQACKIGAVTVQAVQHAAVPRPNLSLPLIPAGPGTTIVSRHRTRVVSDSYAFPRPPPLSPQRRACNATHAGGRAPSKCFEAASNPSTRSSCRCRCECSSAASCSCSFWNRRLRLVPPPPPSPPPSVRDCAVPGRVPARVPGRVPPALRPAGDEARRPAWDDPCLSFAAVPRRPVARIVSRRAESSDADCRRLARALRPRSTACDSISAARRCTIGSLGPRWVAAAASAAVPGEQQSTVGHGERTHHPRSRCARVRRGRGWHVRARAWSAMRFASACSSVSSVSGTSTWCAVGAKPKRMRWHRRG